MDQEPDERRRGPRTMTWVGERLRRLTMGAAMVLIVSLIAASMVLTVAEVIARDVANYEILWSEEASTWALTYVAFIGGALAFQRREYVTLMAVKDRLPADIQVGIDAFLDFATCAIFAAVAVYGVKFSENSRGIVDPLLHISDFWLYIPIGVGTAFMALSSLGRLFTRDRRRAVGIACGAVLAAVGLFGHVLWQSTVTTAEAEGILIGISAVLLVLGLPIFVVFLAGSLTYFFAVGIPVAAVSSDLGDGVASFLLVAIPFFLLAGFILGEMGLSKLLTSAVRALMGRLPGSVMYVIVIGMYLFSGISGSKVGDMAAVGTPILQMCEEEGLDKDEAIAMLAASASMGDTVPPSLALIILSSISGLSTGALFLAGILPATVVGLLLMAQIALQWRHRSKVARQSTWDRARAVVKAVPVLAVVLFLVVSIVTGVATPTEASALSIAYIVLLVLVMQRRRIDWRALWLACERATVLSGVVLLIVATSTVFARAITLANIPQQVAGLLGPSIGRPLFLVISLVLLSIMGMVMEGIPAILVFAPILLPLAAALGISQLQYGILLVMAIGIGANSPPAGIGLYVAAQLGGSTVGAAARKMKWCLLTLYLGLVVVAAFPWLTLEIPKSVGLS